MGKGNVQHHAPYGGQAVIEGVMMRSPRYFAVACRRPDNTIVVQQEDVESYLGRWRFLNKPFLRGTLALIDSMMMGIKALTFSANVAMEEEQKASAVNDFNVVQIPGGVASEKKSSSINDIAVSATMVLGLAMGVGIFVVLPNVFADLLKRSVENGILMNLLEGAFRIVLFVGYIAVISCLKDIRRVFEYHGAEHKVINTFEAGLPLTEESFKKYGTIHPRCGTSFIMIVLALSIILFSFLGWSEVWYERILSRMVLLPVIAGIGYEAIRLAGRFKNSAILNAVLAPGLWLQRLTTREPSDDQIEVALRALEAVLDKENENV
ncbi:MAG: DUF1385 domain-containing protein [Armatimonadota bacterium]